MDLKLRIVAEPETRTRSVVAPDFAGPVFKGSGQDNGLCGSCGKILVEGLGSISNVVIKCFDCGSFNEV